MGPSEDRIRAIGLELLEQMRGDSSRLWSADRWTETLLERSLDDEAARLQLFRFIDVLPALATSHEVVRHLREYFDGRPAPFAPAFRAARMVSGVGPPGEAAVATGLRLAVRALARRFIVGSTPVEAARAVERARRGGLAFTLDVLGEACLGEQEATTYERRYADLVEHLAPEAVRWPFDQRLDVAPWGPVPRVNVSVKLSALYPHLDPIDPLRSSEAVTARLRRIVAVARLRSAHIHVDMEERRIEELTLSTFMDLCDEAELRDYRHLGIVLQAYLRDSQSRARTLVEWARRRGTPVTVRLVKGAYWDYETAHAELEGWPVPVFERKHETDASFEQLTRFFLANADAVDLAVASHNVRSIAHAIAAREQLGLPVGQIEFQTLYGMAAPLARALVARGERVRIYMPFGDLIPGMAYLVRRLLENTSNESFLRRALPSELSRENISDLLRDPATVYASPPSDRAAPRDGLGAFRSEPDLDWALAAERAKLATALGAVRRRLGGEYPVVAGGEALATREWLISRNPSRPAEIVGRAGAASSGDVDRAVAAAVHAFPAWRGRGARERSAVLGRAAELMRERRAELTAWIVYEAGKPWREADGDVAEAIDFVEYYRREAVALQEPRRLGDLRGEINHYLREPRGVAAVIAPWNFPLAILTGMTSAALATGNTVVMKPAEQTPVIAAMLFRVLADAGIPPGVVNYAPGSGEVAGDRLVHHPDVSVIAFTGSREVGTHVYAAAAQAAKGSRHVKRVIAEMGGKNAIIVDDDADLDEAVQGIVGSAFGYAGQKCSACSRVIGVGAVYARLVERLVEAVRTLPMGPADHPGTVMGPVIDAAAAERVRGYIEMGAGLARPVLVREVPRELAATGGHYVAPAIFADAPPACPLMREEIFGPVLSLARAASFAEALDIAVDSDYALTGGVFSRSPRHLRQARDAFLVGNLYVNRGTTGARVGRQPFGGRQASGIGYQAGGPDYLGQFIETRVVTENTLRRGFASDEL
jgi:RHH-type proline utilization regulon transcriptional repressor/proline dehydrogenase/delta 1-pyrroline-5-carboxylate dehydrogenase